MITVDHIAQATADVCLTDVPSLVGAKRHQPLAKYRQIAFYLCRELTSESYSEIAYQFGNRHHTTIIHGVDVIDYHIKKRDKYAGIVDKVRNRAHVLAEEKEVVFRSSRNVPTFKTTRKETT